MFTVVCGSPGSGKTTFVSDHAGPHAITIDLDAIASALNPQWARYDKRPKQLGPILKRIRDVLADSGASEIWLICCSETTARRYAVRHNGTVIQCQWPKPPIQLR